MNEKMEPQNIFEILDFLINENNYPSLNQEKFSAITDACYFVAQTGRHELIRELYFSLLYAACATQGMVKNNFLALTHFFKALCPTECTSVEDELLSKRSNKYLKK